MHFLLILHRVCAIASVLEVIITAGFHVKIIQKQETLVPNMLKSTTKVTRMKVVFILAKIFPLAKITEIEEITG